MNRLDEQYKGLLFEVLTHGVQKKDRTGTGTRSIFGQHIRHDMSEGFPILTTKKVAFKTMVTELKWFLKGDTNIKYLLDNNCHIWDWDAYRPYISKHPWGMEIEEFIETIQKDEKFAQQWGNLGPIYGHQWRKLSQFGVQKDQIKDLIEGLKTNPDSRRHIVNSWNVMDLDKMYLKPCHFAFQCYVADGKLSLMWFQRSMDVPLGGPFNISSYGLLLLLLCHETGYEPGEIIGSIGDAHIYLNQIEGCKEQLGREPRELPQLKLSNVDLLAGEFDAELIGYNPHPAIKFPLST